MNSSIRLIAATAVLAFACPACQKESAEPAAATPPAQEEAHETETRNADMSETNAPTDPALVALQEFTAAQKIDTSNPQWRLKLPQPPKATFDADATYVWNLETSEGPIRVKLLPGEAPMHVTSTIYLTQLGYYDGLAFHRIIPGFMAQGGCPLGRGTSGPGYKYAGEFGDRKHDRPGILSMANAGPGTDGSQFFLTFVPTPWLDGKHTIFGEVIDGLPVLEALEQFGSQSGATSKKCSIVSATISVE